MIAVGALIGVLHAPEDSSERNDLSKLYENCIVKKIEKCESQADLLYASRSETLRSHARLQDKKAQFWDAQKDMLIDTMLQSRLEPKQYKIEHFLEVQFYQSMAE
jgi:hypothetical protein